LAVRGHKYVFDAMLPKNNQKHKIKI